MNENFKSGERRKEPYLSEEQIEKIATRAAARAQVLVEAYVGRIAIRAFLSAIGAAALAALAWVKSNVHFGGK